MLCQRALDLFAGRTPDRLPWLPELNAGFLRKTLGLGAGVASSGQEQPYFMLERGCAERIGADHLHRVTSVKTRHRRCTIETDAATNTTVVHTPRGELRKVQQWDGNSGTVFTREHFVKGLESFAAFRAFVEDEAYEPDFERAGREMDQSGFVTIDVPATPLMHLLMWEFDVQPTLMAMMDHEDQMAELMAAMHEKNKEYYRLAVAGPGTILRPMEDTSSMLTGPRMYARHCVAHLNDYAEIVHGAGKVFLPHMCGHLDGMLDVLKDVALDGIEAVTPPPLGDASLERIRRKLGNIWIMGGVDPSQYANATPETMRQHVGHTLDVMRGDRRFILGHEEIPLVAKLENVKVVAELVAATAGDFYR